MGRWKKEEEEALAEMKRRIKDRVEKVPQFPEVVGDRRLMRFLRGLQLNVQVATDQYLSMLNWREANHVDEIRQEIVYGGKNCPFDFPRGRTIIDLCPQIVVTPHACDRKGRPLCLERYCFNPKEVMKIVSKEEYLHFLMYTLEYRTLVIEQISHEREQEYLRTHPEPEDNYGVMLMDYTIRDLDGLGFAHIGSDGRTILKSALEMGLPNYPEFLGKSHMVNTPGIFQALWVFIKGLLDEFTLAKIELTGYNFMDKLLKDISIENIPKCLGGKFELYNEPFTFDTSRNGPLWYTGCDEDAKKYIKVQPKHEENGHGENGHAKAKHPHPQNGHATHAHAAVTAPLPKPTQVNHAVQTKPTNPPKPNLHVDTTNITINNNLNTTVQILQTIPTHTETNSKYEIQEFPKSFKKYLLEFLKFCYYEYFLQFLLCCIAFVCLIIVDPQLIQVITLCMVTIAYFAFGNEK